MARYGDWKRVFIPDANPVWGSGDACAALAVSLFRNRHRKTAKL
ncbi:hypothetical protein BURMUCGD1_0822 [Burkholderia multivorans CGD1]|nr:hypothetical protein BURMUCGD1_0822 [Burkholderia multivorans CGD1]